MVKAKVIYHQKMRLLEGRFEACIKAYAVSNNKKFPDGVKLSCILLDLHQKAPRLLLDNHEPYGYHLHTKMPYDKAHRALIHVRGFEEAIEFFMDEVQKVINEET